MTIYNQEPVNHPVGSSWTPGVAIYEHVHYPYIMYIYTLIVVERYNTMWPQNCTNYVMHCTRQYISTLLKLSLL